MVREFPREHQDHSLVLDPIYFLESLIFYPCLKCLAHPHQMESRTKCLEGFIYFPFQRKLYILLSFLFEAFCIYYIICLIMYFCIIYILMRISQREFYFVPKIKFPLIIEIHLISVITIKICSQQFSGKFSGTISYHLSQFTTAISIYPNP